MEIINWFELTVIWILISIILTALDLQMKPVTHKYLSREQTYLHLLYVNSKFVAIMNIAVIIWSSIYCI